MEGMILGGVGMLLGIGAVWFRVERVMKALKASSEVLTALVDAMEDKNITKEELDVIMIEIRQALNAFKAIVSK